MSVPRSLRERARRYLLLGWAILVVPFMSKNPGYPGWQDTRLTEPELAAAFPEGKRLNIGVLLGPPSGNLADVDLDTWLAILLAGRFLPATHAIFGRPSARRSHHLFVVIGILKSTAWRDPLAATNDERGTLLEIRFSGQTLLPGSTHPSGEPVDWDEEGDVAEVTGEELLRACNRLAAAALFARHWPGAGNRHVAALALAGGLLRAGWSVDETVRFLGAVVTGAGDDEPVDRLRTVVTTAQTQEQGKPTTGWTRLSSLIDPKIIAASKQWLGIVDGPTILRPKNSRRHMAGLRSRGPRDSRSSFPDRRLSAARACVPPPWRPLDRVPGRSRRDPVPRLRGGGDREDPGHPDQDALAAQGHALDGHRGRIRRRQVSGG